MFLSHFSSISVRSSAQWGGIIFKLCLRRVSIKYWLTSCGINGVEGLGRGDTKDCVRGHRDHYLPGQFRNSHHYRSVCEVCYGNKISLFVFPFYVIDCQNCTVVFKQDVVFALAHATGKVGRFTLIERWRNNERLLAPQEYPLKVTLIL